MQQPAEDDPRSDSAPAGAGRAPVDRKFAALVGDLCTSDPHFARRVSEAHRFSAGHLMILLGFAATVLLGIAPLVVGIHLQAAVLLTIGAIGTAFSPLVVPPVVGLVLSRVRPAW